MGVLGINFPICLSYISIILFNKTTNSKFADHVTDDIESFCHNLKSEAVTASQAEGSFVWFYFILFCEVGIPCLLIRLGRRPHPSPTTSQAWSPFRHLFDSRDVRCPTLPLFESNVYHSHCTCSPPSSSSPSSLFLPISGRPVAGRLAVQVPPIHDISIRLLFLLIS